jgi:hypothetical protein
MQWNSRPGRALGCGTGRFGSTASVPVGPLAKNPYLEKKQVLACMEQGVWGLPPGSRGPGQWRARAVRRIAEKQAPNSGDTRPRVCAWLYVRLRAGQKTRARKPSNGRLQICNYSEESFRRVSPCAHGACADSAEGQVIKGP